MSLQNPNLLEKIGWRIEALAYDAVSGLLRALPVDTASAFGGWLFRRVGPLTPSHRTASDNLKLAFPEMGEEERERLLAEQWDSVARAFAE